ncbi:MAG: hypothetical protein ACKOUT_05210 [Novosphingobium sp.]
MDCDAEVSWRGRVLLKKGLIGERTEFFFHGGDILLITYRPSKVLEGAKVTEIIIVPNHFREIARRYHYVVESYYLELTSANGRLHESNVLAAVEAASGVARWVRRWVMNCSASGPVAASIALTVFDVIKLHLAYVARDQHKLSDVEVLEAVGRMAVAMKDVARRVNAECRRTVA